eukprot:9331643-Pyramimonas_sp.AAC.1
MPRGRRAPLAARPAPSSTTALHVADHLGATPLTTSCAVRCALVKQKTFTDSALALSPAEELD